MDLSRTLLLFLALGGLGAVGLAAQQIEADGAKHKAVTDLVGRYALAPGA